VRLVLEPCGGTDVATAWDYVQLWLPLLDKLNNHVNVLHRAFRTLQLCSSRVECARWKPSKLAAGALNVVARRALALPTQRIRPPLHSGRVLSYAMRTYQSPSTAALRYFSTFTPSAVRGVTAWLMDRCVPWIHLLRDWCVTHSLDRQLGVYESRQKTTSSSC